jgi:hypothetical protein
MTRAWSGWMCGSAPESSAPESAALESALASGAFELASNREAGRPETVSTCGFGISPGLKTGGERGIRTPDTRKGIHAFEARAFSHSAISPRPRVSFLFYQGSRGLRISLEFFAPQCEGETPSRQPAGRRRYGWTESLRNQRRLRKKKTGEPRRTRSITKDFILTGYCPCF